MNDQEMRTIYLTVAQMNEMISALKEKGMRIIYQSKVLHGDCDEVMTQKLSGVMSAKCVLELTLAFPGYTKRLYPNYSEDSE